MDINEILSKISNSDVLTDGRILNILNDLGYYKEHPNHRYIMKLLVEMNILRKLTDIKLPQTVKTSLFQKFITNTGFDIRLCASIFSSITGLPYSLFDDRIQWSYDLSKDDMKKYILQHLTHSFDKRIIVKNIDCGVRDIDDFYIYFEFQKTSWNFDYEKENAHYIKSGELNRCKSNEVSLEIWTRSGNNIFTHTGYNHASGVYFRWEDDELIETVVNQYDIDYQITHTGILTLIIDIRHPIYDLSWIRVMHPC